MSQREPFAHYRERLAEVGFRPSRRLGQNFLLDPEVHRQIAEAAELGPQDLVLEVGVGLGFLTRELAARAGRVLGVEVDRRLLQIVRDEFSDFPDRGRNVRLIQADVLGEGEELHKSVSEALSAEREGLEGRFVVVSNPPYSIAGPLMARCMTLAQLPDCLVVLIPRELADRWASPCGTRAYGALSVLIQTGYATTVLRNVPRQVFWPRPRVDSAVLRLARRRDDGRPGPEERRGLQAFLRALFSSRRKMLSNSLPVACRALGLPPGKEEDGFLNQRPEALEPDDLLALYRRCASFS